ncbi:MAG: NYN domain-containing protein [Verrucomicrobiota bacterium]
MRYLLVDAHSVIFAWPELRSLHNQRSTLARGELIKLLTHYQDSTGTRVVAVFDGKGAKNAEASEPGGIQVFYSSSKHTADSIIERLVAKYSAEHEMIVVTNDYLEQQTAITFGGTAISVEMFRQWFDDAERDLSRQLRKLKTKR